MADSSLTRMQQQSDADAALLAGGTHQRGVLLHGQLPILGAVGLILDAHLPDAAILPPDEAEKAVEGGQNGVDAGGGEPGEQIVLVLQRRLMGQRLAAQPLGEISRIAAILIQCGRGFFFIFQRGAEGVQLLLGDGHVCGHIRGRAHREGLLFVCDGRIII